MPNTSQHTWAIVIKNPRHDDSNSNLNLTYWFKCPWSLQFLVLTVLDSEQPAQETAGSKFIT